MRLGGDPVMRLERIPWPEAEAPPDADALAQRLAEEGFDAFSWTDAPGADYAPHEHPHDESLWVVRGRITFGAEGSEFVLGPGDRLMLPKGTVHTARVGPAGATYFIGRRE